MILQKKLSIIIPAYKQEKTIFNDIMAIRKVMSTLPYVSELIIVVDGYVDKTYEVANKLSNNSTKVVGYEKNYGKGYAIKYGVQYATGDVIGFIDAGTDIDPQEISTALIIMQSKNADIVIGSKLHPDSIVKYPIWRHIISWCYRFLLYVLFDLTVSDTQVGFKLFKKKVAKDVFPRILVKGFAFDVELLAVANALGYNEIFETPIKLNFKSGSINSKSLWRIIFWMLWDTFAVFYRLKILRYYSKESKSYK